MSNNLEFYSGNIKKYSDLIINSQKAYIDEFFKNQEAHAVLEKGISDALEGKKAEYPIRKGGKRLRYIIHDNLFTPFFEIAESYEVMKNILLYINSFPYKNKKISRLSFLLYHLSNYLNEIYIIYTRINGFLSKIEKAYKLTENYAKIIKNNPKLKKLIEKSFKKLIDIRGKHIHQFRYSDNEIDQLKLLDLLGSRLLENDSELKAIKLAFKSYYSKIKLKWKKTIFNNQIQILEVLDIIFEIILDYLTENGKFIEPKGFQN